MSTIQSSGIASQELKDEVSGLISKFYMKHIKDHFLSVLKIITELDIKERFLQSLRNGYIGFEVHKHPMVLTWTDVTKNIIKDVIRAKIIAAEMNGVATLILIEDSLSIIAARDMLPSEICGSGAIRLVHDTGKIFIEVRDDVTRLIDRVEYLEADVKFRPGSWGSEQAAQHFRSIATDNLTGKLLVSEHSDKNISGDITGVRPLDDF